MRLGAGTAFVFPLAPRDIEAGYVVMGYTFELALESRAALWSPGSAVSDGSALFENTIGLVLRARLFSDIIGQKGYPAPTRFE